MEKGFIDHEEIQREMIMRLKKVEGQVRGISKMIQEKRNCGEIVTQLGAIKAAINRVGFTVLACHMAGCIEDCQSQGGNSDQALNEFMEVLKKYS